MKIPDGHEWDRRTIARAATGEAKPPDKRNPDDLFSPGRKTKGRANAFPKFVFKPKTLLQGERQKLDWKFAQQREVERVG